MRLKSKHRRQAFRDGGRIDELPIPIEPPVEAAAPEAPPAVENQPEPPPVPESAPAPDDATAALRRQIEALNHARTVDQQAAIAQQGANERRQAWLAQTPGAKDHIALGHIHRAALDAGFVDTSPEYFRFMESQLAALKQPAEEMQQELAMQPTPQFFKPAGRSAPNPSSIVSAPVSREIPTSSGERLRPRGQVKLTPAEVEAARISGITPEEYAKQKIRKAQMVASGEYGEQR